MGKLFADDCKQAAVSLPDSYTLSMIDEGFYILCKSESWSTDLVSQFFQPMKPFADRRSYKNTIEGHYQHNSFNPSLYPVKGF